MTTDCEIGVSGEPKADCSTRQRINSPSEVARPHITVAAVNPATPQIMARRRPKRLEIQPGKGNRDRGGDQIRRHDPGHLIRARRQRTLDLRQRDVGDGESRGVERRNQRASDETPHGARALSAIQDRSADLRPQPWGTSSAPCSYAESRRSSYALHSFERRAPARSFGHRRSSRFRTFFETFATASAPCQIISPTTEADLVIEF